MLYRKRDQTLPMALQSVEQLRRGNILLLSIGLQQSIHVSGFKQFFPRLTKVGQVIGIQRYLTTVLNGVCMKVKSIGKEHFPEQ